MKSLKRRVAAAVAVIAAGALALGGCAGPGAGKDTFTVWWYEAPDSAMGISWKSALDQFRAEHPDLDVVFELKNWDQLEKTGQMVLNSSAAPDVMEYPKGKATAGVVSRAGLLTDLTSVARDRGWSDKIADSVLTVGTYDENGLMGNGSLFGVPVYGEYVSLYANEDALAAIGRKPPTTLAELEATLQAFVDAGVTPLALGSSAYPIAHLVYQLALLDADRGWIDDFQFFAGEPDFALWESAATIVSEWVQKGYIARDSTGIDADGAGTGFQDGTYPLFLSGSWWDAPFTTNITTFTWSKTLFPETSLFPGSGGNLWVVPTNADHKDLAYDFIGLTLDTERQTLLGNSGGVPVAADPEAITNPVGRLAAEQFAMIADNNGLAYYPDWPVAGFYDVLLSGSQGLVSGSVSPAEFVRTIRAFYDAGVPAS